MKLLTRADLSDDQYFALRDAPHLVALAVSAAAGSFVDEIRERTAANQAVASGEASEHPLIREIAGTDDIKDAGRAARAAVFGRDPGHRSATDLRALALEALGKAVAILRSQGGDLDCTYYRHFVVSVAQRVSGAAREGDVLGVGGQLVGEAEREVIEAVGAMLA